jgi:predicted nuclease of predicted toxin-antitoxin system
MKFLVDRYAGRRLADWLRSEGHDVIESCERGSDPGDRTLLELAAGEGRVLVTIDTDFGALVFVEGMPHCGVVRLPDVMADARIALMQQVLERHSPEVETGAIITVRGGRIRISQPPR